jgi:glycosyltransferase involved in cell wall biosynthesis
MKLVIQIPCWNEEQTIAEAIRSLPGNLEGIDTIEVIIIDDGSTDLTAAAARNAGIAEVVRLPRHMGLAAAFSAGIDTAIRRNADILVNTDADLQYPSEYIAAIVAPIVRGEADIVIGDRLSFKPRPFPPVKMFLERLGSWILSMFSGVRIRDAASGFRALSRDTLHSMVILDEFSYTLESLLLAGAKKLRVVNVTIPTNKARRKSRLFKNVGHYLLRSVITITRIYLMYHPLKFFVTLGIVCLMGSMLLGIRYLYYFINEGGGGHIQSLILLAVLAGAGFQCVILGLLADVVSANRRLLEQMRLKQRGERHERE